MSFTSPQKRTTLSTFENPVLTDPVGRYLIDRSSGPFIDHCLAHQQIAFSCITYLNSNLDFIPSAVDQKTRNVSETLIINRYNGLHHYANNFWIDHVLAYSRAGGKINNCKYLVQAFKQLLNLWRRKEESSITTAPSETIFRGQENQENSGLSVCCEDACLSDMLEHFAGFRKKLHTKENTFESPECESRPLLEILCSFLLILTDIASTYEVGERQ